MPEWFQVAIQNGHDLPLATMLFRLLSSFALGVVVAMIYRWSQRKGETFPSSFLATLVLMTIVIAMSTQVIGDNIARAFSLVGALSIVRFRTVVQNTRDTVFVIFAVVVGMAVGAGHFAVAILGITITGIASFVMIPRSQEIVTSPHLLLLTVRLGLGVDPDIALDSVFKKYLETADLRETSTAKQGSVFDFTYYVQLLEDVSFKDFLSELNLTAGVQQVELRKR